MSISELQAVPKFITLSDLLIFWFICRFAACLCMSRITLWLGQKLGNLLPALFISAVAYCLPALLSLSGMKNGIEWLGVLSTFPRRCALADPRRQHPVGADFSCLCSLFCWRGQSGKR